MQQKSGMVFRLLMTIIVGAFIFQKVNWIDLVKALEAVQWSYFAPAVLLWGAAYVMAAWRWRLLLKVHFVTVSICQAFYLTLVGAFFNAFLFGSTGGDVAKTLLLMRQASQQKSEILSSVFIDRLLGMFVLLMSAIICIGLTPQLFLGEAVLASVAHTLMMLFVTIFIFIIALLFLPLNKTVTFIQDNLFRSRAGLIDKAKELGRHIRAKKIAFFGAIVASGCVQFMVFASVYYIALAMDIDINFEAIVIMITIVTCITSLPVSIGGHGVREGAFLLVFHWLYPVSGGHTYSNETILLFSLLYLIVNLVWSGFGGILYFCKIIKMR